MPERNETEARVKELRALIEYHSNAYYNADAPEIEDDEYDALMRELRELEAAHPEWRDENSPTVKVGGAASAKFASVLHEVPMQSLQDVFSLEEIRDFCEKCAGLAGGSLPELVVEKKIDGLSVSLEYTDGVLTRGSTRGDGRTGEDITENLLTIASIPHRLEKAPAFLEVRGEVYMPRRTFAALNQTQEENGQKTFKNPRNAAAGSLRQKDASITAARGLDIFVFNVQQVRGASWRTHAEALAWLRDCGFCVSPGYTVVTTVEEAEEIVQDTLLAAYQRLNDFDARRASFTVWLQRIAFYTVSHHLRKHHPTFISMDESQETISATTDAALDRLLSEEGPDLGELLDCALEQLRPEERMLLQLFYNDGQSLSDIAFIFGMTDKASTARAVSALTSRLHRIRKKLFVNIKRLRHEYQ